MKFRHELKYLINEGDAELLRERLRVLLKLDKNAVNGEYHIRSLYFDDYWNSAYVEKQDGVSARKKYRIRVYNVQDSVIKLECKMKSGSYIAKTSAKLTREEYDKIIAGDYAFLLKRDENLCKQFYYELTSKMLRPKVFVDYEREPFVLDAGTVRITFDKNVRGAYPGFGMFDDNLVFHPVLEPGKLVLEVKFTEFLPKAVADILPLRAAENTSVSKFVLCADQVNYLSAATNLF